MHIVRRDFFLSGEASIVNTILTTAMSDRIILPAPGRNQLAPKIAGRCSQSGLGPAAPTGKSQSKLSTVARWNATAGAIKSGQLDSWGGGALTHEGQVA